MKKIALIVLVSFIWMTALPQKWQVVTSNPGVPFKRHFSYSIEKGSVNGASRQVIAGNQTDWLVNSRVIMGNTNLFLSGRAVQLANPDDNILMTDFTIAPGSGDSQYAAGTGIYFPSGANGPGYVFLGIYERGTGTLTNLVYYDLSYSAADAQNTTGTRIKYSETENAYYISGVMVDRRFVVIDPNNLDCHTKGFILKVSAPYNVANVLVFDPDQLDPRVGWLCSVNDIEINSSEKAIAFTGITTKRDFTGNYQPMIGMIDMNLNLLWCYAYELTDYRYSGVDVIFGENDNSVYALFNSESRPFAVMQVDLNGIVMQQPQEYTFDMPLCINPGPMFPALARAHTMHLVPGPALIVTGNTYVEDDNRNQYQSLFKYDIPDANNLSSGMPTVGHYSCDLVPIGNQSGITSWWAPENSVYMDNNIYMVGSYTDNMVIPTLYGYNFINVNGFDVGDPHCYTVGNVTLTGVHSPSLKQPVSMTRTQAHDIPFNIYSWTPDAPQTCPPGHGKAAIGSDENNMNGNIFKYMGIDEGGVHGILNAEKQSQFQVSIYDIAGKKVFSADYTVEGQKTVYLKFHPTDQLYLITVSNGSKTETLKVPGIR